MAAENSDISRLQKRKRFFLFWAIAATLAAVVFANLSLFLFVRLRASSQDAEALTQRLETKRSTAPRSLRPRVESSPEASAATYPTRGSPLTRPINAAFTNLSEA